MQDFYKQKYLKYKQKYLSLRDSCGYLNKIDPNKKNFNIFGGGDCFKYGLQQHIGECWHDALSMMLFQSDITNENNEFLKLSDHKIHKQYQYLLELFSPENLELNSYKLPTEIYIYYLKNKTNPDINDKITKFLDLSKKYMFGQVKRIENRVKNDIPRYDPEYLLTSFRDGRELFEERIKRDLEKNKERDKEIFKEILLKNPDYPNRDELLKKINMTDAEMEEYKKTPEYQSELELFKQYLDSAYKQKELERIHIESTLPKREKLARQLSIRKSIECSLDILHIAKLFNLTQVTHDKLSHGGTFVVKNLAKEILNLYMDNTNYYYSDTINLSNYYTYSTLINMLNNSQLIGIDIGIMFISGGAHAISAYTCGNNQILYDDNLPEPLKINWKDSLIRILTKIKKTNKIIPIPYFDDDLILYNLDLDQINLENFDNIRQILKEKIDKMYEENKKNILQQMITNPQLEAQKDIILQQLSTLREQLEFQYIQSHIANIYSITPSIMKIAAKTEEEHLLTNVITKLSLKKDDLDIAINRLLNIKKINIGDNDEILNLIKAILDKNTNINLYVIYYLFKIIEKNYDYDYIYVDKIKIQILNKYPQIINNFEDIYTIINNIRIYLYILFLNTPESEIFLENLEDIEKEYIVERIDDERYVNSIKDIVKDIKLNNITNSLFKEKIINILSKYIV